MTIQWTDEWSVGNEEIDEQHKELFERINALLDAVGRARSNDEVATTMAFLETYVNRHFRDEERLMTISGYPDREAHCAKHVAFVGVFERLKSEFDRTGVSAGLSQEINMRVSGWLLNHIGKVDRAFGRYLATKVDPAPSMATKPPGHS